MKNKLKTSYGKAFYPGGKKSVVHELWSGGISCITFDKSGNYLVSAGTDGSLIFHSVSDPMAQPAEALEGSNRDVTVQEYEACGECCKPDDTNEELYSKSALGEGIVTSGESK